MSTVQRRTLRLAAFALVGLATTYLFLQRMPHRGSWQLWNSTPHSFDWEHRPIKNKSPPSSAMYGLPKGDPLDLPRIQHNFAGDEVDEAHAQRQLERREAVKDAARKCWESYRDYAWGYDELRPIALRGANTYSGWGATLVDSLDSLWIMDLKAEFADAVHAVAAIDWNASSSWSCSLFETTIRYLGGLLAAYELSGEEILLTKAKELGHMLYAGFDTPSGLPANDFDFGRAREGSLVAGRREALAVPGTLSLEFTKLSQLSGDPKYYRAIQYITARMNETQDATRLPGMWPKVVDLQNGFLTTDNSFTLGAMSDSAYEYLGKMHMLLGGLDPVYEEMHKKAMKTIKEHLLFRPMLPDTYPDGTPDILFSGTAYSNSRTVELVPEVQHLGCFTGAMFAVGGKIFGSEEDVKIGEQLARGCGWMYSAFPTGIMPETSRLVECKNRDLSPCPYDSGRMAQSRGRGLPIAFHDVSDPRYLLRPEAIESIFVLYRITGKKDLQDVAWAMFQSLREAAETEMAFSSITDVKTLGRTNKMDSMEVRPETSNPCRRRRVPCIPTVAAAAAADISLQSFFFAETLKYFYLVFADPSLISLDEYVLNTEAHPLKRPQRSRAGSL